MTNGQLCAKEHSFKSSKDAHKQLAHMNSRKGRHQYRLYKCDKCGNFHITTITKNIAPQKKQKYKLDMSKQGSSKIDGIPGMKAIIQAAKVEKQIFHTGTFMTKQQAETLEVVAEFSRKFRIVRIKELLPDFNIEYKEEREVIEIKRV